MDGEHYLTVLMATLGTSRIQHNTMQNTIDLWSELERQLQSTQAEFNKQAAERDTVHQPIADNKPPPTREGYKMVAHGDHWHEMPIDVPDTWQGELHEPTALTEALIVRMPLYIM